MSFSRAGADAGSIPRRADRRRFGDADHGVAKARGGGAGGGFDDCETEDCFARESITRGRCCLFRLVHGKFLHDACTMLDGARHLTPYI